ncbi:AraC family transcriptional regulator [Actinoplanes italicus]|uniref:AraC family transcriptional regulator n=1 Tax=Actinoplanes italicus TaxID=113567 RepID=A0A2T0KH31_9ACTN|nr:AraC family transcriptional regulator [Actinoplanes italicus]PRX22547.1 AraC family transcriptional regulator [Actinoplanes italicus]GIE28063.1 AraC family transcriptional regulator [Actinoplanes italicus]
MTEDTATAGRVRRFSTAELPVARRVELWEDHNRDALIGLRCRLLGDAPFDGTELNLHLDRVQLARVRGTSHVVERPAEVVRRNPADAIAVYLTLVGEAFFYHEGGVLTLKPGQALICDADRPFMRGFSHGLEELAIKVPRAVFRDLTGVESVPAPMARPTSRALARSAGRALRPEGGPVDERTLLHLVADLTGRTVADPVTVHLANARAFVEDHLTDPGLTAARVAAGIGISERHLSRAFASTGESLPRFVLTRRLELAHRLLTGGSRAGVAGIAAACGFGSASYFTQVFRAHFGMRPTDVRKSAAPSDFRREPGPDLARPPRRAANGPHDGDH